MLKMTKPTTWEMTFAAIVNPWTIKIVVTAVGFLRIWSTTADADEVTVVIKKTCMTWNAKYELCLRTKSHDHGNQRHQDCECDRREKASDHAHNDIWDLFEPRQEGQVLEVGHVADDTDDAHGNSPEYDHDGDEANDSIPSDKLLPPRNGQRAPDNVLRGDANVGWGHSEACVVREDLVSRLSFGLALELDEHGGDLLVAARKISGLCSLCLGDKPGKLGAAPIDGVHLLADQTQKSGAMRRPLLLRDPSASDAAGLGIQRRVSTVCRCALGGLDTLLVGELDELDLGLFQPEGHLVSLLDQLLDFLDVAVDPDVLDRVSENLAQYPLLQVIVGNRGEENSPRGHAIGVERADEESLAEIDVVYTFTEDQVHDEAVVQPCDKYVRIVAVALGVRVDVRIRKNVELHLATTTGNVDWKKDRPGDAASHETDNNSHLQAM
ncbi:hypothetical protein FJTKL_12471 [Diaporthe vaccinii]|uniref:Uncharacterized protein n=1 Tax=Diaporthe vaccinii TaxID=105482 RepID=A0ABR4EDK3_9PEZI